MSRPDSSGEVGSASVRVRERLDSDLPGCLDALLEVHLANRYPLFRERVSVEFITPAALAWAVVAELDGRVVGHAALIDGMTHPPPGGLPDGDPADALELTRLFVAPSARGRGVADVLLDAAVAYAASVGRVLALVVLEKDAAAIRVYQRRGWRELGRGSVSWTGPGGVPVNERSRHFVATP